MRNYFIPTIKEYAKRVKCDFILMNDYNARFYKTWNQLQCLEYLRYYDRILYIDGDIYIPKKNHVNFFNEVPYGKIGLYRVAKAPKIKCCKYTFVALLIDKNSLRYILPITQKLPSYNYQKLLFDNKVLDKCMLGISLKYSCYLNEECWLNEQIYRNKSFDKITYLSHLVDEPYIYLKFNKLINDMGGNIYHVKLNTNIDGHNTFYKYIQLKLLLLDCAIVK